MRSFLPHSPASWLGYNRSSDYIFPFGPACSLYGATLYERVPSVLASSSVSPIQQVCTQRIFYAAGAGIFNPFDGPLRRRSQAGNCLTKSAYINTCYSLMRAGLDISASLLVSPQGSDCRFSHTTACGASHSVVTGAHAALPRFPRDCPVWIFPVLREVFGSDYSLEAHV